MKGEGAMRFGHLAFEPKPSAHESFWLDHSTREGFTEHCAKALKQSVSLDVVNDAQVRAMVQRQDLLSALEGVRSGKSNSAIRRANVVGN